ncbi:mitochondrial import inner membrane translocase subunit Tim21 [Arapaima gigas]
MFYSLVLRLQQAGGARRVLHTFREGFQDRRAILLNTAGKRTRPGAGIHSGGVCEQRRAFSVDFSLNSKEKSHEKVPQVSESGPHANLPPVSAAQKVKQAGKDFTYLMVVVIGIGVTGGLLYVIFKELFSSSSPSKIYGKALEKCRAHPEVIGAFGEPIKGYGETTRRGRRQQVSHIEYIKDGLKHMRIKFYIEGAEPHLQGIVHTEMKENPETGKYEFRYIFVDIDSYPRRTIVVEDNR